MASTIVEINDALLTEDHRGGMLLKEPSDSTLQRELGRWKNYSTSEMIEAYVRLGAGWPRLLLRVRESQLKAKKAEKRAKMQKEQARRRQARKKENEALQKMD
jgi:hypothetical protein